MLKKTRHKLLSLHLFITCRKNSQEHLMMFGAANKHQPEAIIKFKGNVELNNKLKILLQESSQVFSHFDILNSK